MDVAMAVDVDVAMVLSVVMGCHGNSETEIQIHSYRIHICTYTCMQIPSVVRQADIRTRACITNIKQGHI